MMVVVVVEVVVEVRAVGRMRESSGMMVVATETLGMVVTGVVLSMVLLSVVVLSVVVLMAW